MRFISWLNLPRHKWIQNRQIVLVRFDFKARPIELFLIVKQFFTRCFFPAQYFDFTDSVPKCSKKNKKFFISFVFTLINVIILENKKGYNSVCTGVPDECDSLLGLYCQGTKGSKTCQ